MFGLGVTEIAVLITVLGGFGLPLGVPPAPENPALQHVAPQKCLYYSTWAGMAAADGKSTNHTEQLFAEPEVQEFARAIEKSLSQWAQHTAGQNRDPKADLLAKTAPQWARTVITRASALFVTKVEVVTGRLQVDGGLLVDAGADEAPLLVANLVELMKSPDNVPTPVTLGAAKFARFAPQRGAPLEAEITIGAAGPYVLIGFGKGSVEGMMDRVRTKQTPAWLTDIAQRLPVERRASMSYVNMPDIIKVFAPLGPDGVKIAQLLGLDQLGEMISVTGLDKTGMVSRSLVKTEGKPTGLLALLETEGIKSADVGFVPKDATFATAFALDAQQLYALARQLTSLGGPEGVAEFDDMAAEFHEVFGLRLQEDLLASLGETWTLSMAPADGWLGVNATVEVRDAARVNQLLKQIQGKLSDAPPGSGAPQIEAATFGTSTVYSLALPGMPIRPAWCVADNRLIVALTPQTIKGQLGAKPAEVGLFARPEFAAAFRQDARVVSLSYQDTAKVFETAYSYVGILVPMMLDAEMAYGFRQGPPPPRFFDPATLPSTRSISRHLQPTVTVVWRTKDGLETETHQTFPTLNIGTTAPVAVAVMLPAVQAARSAARRMQSGNNLKQIVLGAQNYHDTFSYMPAAYSIGKDKKPLLSWRVHLLPFMEQRRLYDQFKLDEPWDSEHNKQLIAMMPAVYRSPGSNAKPGESTYLAIGGERGVFPKPTEGARGISFAAVTDGTANTVAVIEAGDELAEIWTKPTEFVPDEKDPLKGLKGPFPGGFLAAFLDGHVQFIKLTNAKQTIYNLFQRDEGAVIPELQ